MGTGLFGSTGDSGLGGAQQAASNSGSNNNNMITRASHGSSLSGYVERETSSSS